MSSHIWLPTKISVAEYLSDLDHFHNEGKRVDFTQLSLNAENAPETKMYQNHAQKEKNEGIQTNKNI